MSTDPADVRKPEFVLSQVNEVTNNISVGYEIGNAVLSVDDVISDYVDLTGNRAYTVDENPVFINPTLGDYRLKDGADFTPIPLEKIGRY